MPSVIFSANRGYALKSSRENIIQHFVSCGWQVILATADDEESRELSRKGVIVEPVTFGRGGFSLTADVHAYRRLQSIYRQYRPELVHHFHAKPVIMGSLAARNILGSSVRIVNSITGLGHAFVKGGMVMQLASAGYRLALPRSDMTVFQNRDDQEFFHQHGWVNDNNHRLIVGSGIDVERFYVAQRENHDSGAPTVIMLGRLLGQKGTCEFVEVAKRVRQRWPKSRFIWAGEEDFAHPDAVSGAWMQGQPGVEYVGRLSDVVPLMSSADLLLFSSYYREGVPRAVMEASATGLPTVAFDAPGVREAVQDGSTGYLVPIRDVDAMEAKVLALVDDVQLRTRLGRQAREHAVREFDIRRIQAAYFTIYRDLGVNIPLPE